MSWAWRSPKSRHADHGLPLLQAFFSRLESGFEGFKFALVGADGFLPVHPSDVRNYSMDQTDFWSTAASKSARLLSILNISFNAVEKERAIVL